MNPKDAVLAHRFVGAQGAAAEQLVVFLHGILGRGDNWQGFAQRLVAERPRFGAVLVDLREHGNSRGMAPPHTLAAATADVARLLATLADRPRVVVGHSFGGKVALGLLGNAPQALEQLWVLDASPSARAERDPGDTTRYVVETLSARPGPWPSRNAFTSELIASGIEKGTGQWLAKNLVHSEGGLHFNLDLSAIRALFADYDRVDLWPLLEQVRERPRVHFVLGGRSQSLLPNDRVRLAELAEQGRVELNLLENAGHWLHTDDPEGLLRALLAALPV